MATPSNRAGMPTRIQVGNRTLRFRFVSPKTRPEMHGYNGLTYLDEGEILIDRSLLHDKPLDSFVEVVVHEIFHVIHYVHGVDDDSKEEQFTDAQAKGWLAFLLHNPRFAQWLDGRLTAIRKARKAIT